MDINAWWVGAGGLALVLILVFGAWLVTVIVRRSNDRAAEDTAPFDVTPPAEAPDEPVEEPVQESPEEPPAG